MATYDSLAVDFGEPFALVKFSPRKVVFNAYVVGGSVDTPTPPPPPPPPPPVNTTFFLNGLVVPRLKP